MSTDYTTRQSGQPFTREFRLYVSKADKLVSPWHDNPLFHDEEEHIMNMVVEVPRWENVKLEVSESVVCMCRV
jgi:inorganic pyrophosphatase